MPQQILYLTECPFCGAEVYFDVREARLNVLDELTRNGDFDVGPDQRIIVYNSDRPEPGPCEHFVDLYGDITGQPQSEVGEFCFHWRAPLRSEIDPDRAAFDHLRDLIDSDVTSPASADDDLYGDVLEDESEDALPSGQRLDDELRANCPQTRFTLERFWHDFTIESKRMYVTGMYIFAEDVREFFRELHALAKQHQLDCDAVRSAS